jgi:hypothetical protein
MRSILDALDFSLVGGERGEGGEGRAGARVGFGVGGFGGDAAGFAVGVETAFLLAGGGEEAHFGAERWLLCLDVWFVLVESCMDGGLVTELSRELN